MTSESDSPSSDGAARVVIVPGLAVRGYAVQAASALTAAGYAVGLEDPPGWADRTDDLAA